ncbi:hypothetical protein ACEPAG_1542 [Sanghuangporus baumii]
MSPAIGDYVHDSKESRQRVPESHPLGGRERSSSRPLEAKPEADVKVQCEQLHRRPPYRMVIQDAGVTLMLNGQEECATVPEYGRGARVDGTVSFANSSSITKVEVKIEGHVIVEEVAGNGSSCTPVLSELLVYWDAPNRLGGYGSGHASGSFAPQPGSCPHSFAFNATLPTHYTEEDGSACPLPPSFAETLPGIPGFHCNVRYEINIALTRVRDMKVKTLRAQWRRNTVFRVPIEYRPRTRPSQPAPFPTNSDPNKGPITRFMATLDSNTPSVKPLKAVLYLPNSQITPLSLTIPFYLRVSGPESTMKAYSRPPLSSFLPKTEPDGFPTICSVIGHVVNENLQNIKLGRVLSLPGSRSDSWTSLDGEKEPARWQNALERDRKTRGAAPSTGVRVLLVRVVSVHANLYSKQNSHQPEPHDEFDLDPDSDTFSESGSFLNRDGSGGRTGSRMFKRTVLGEGMMYTANVSRGSVTWAGEIRIDPKHNVRTGGFSTGSMIVRDMLVVSVREPHTEMSSGKRREIQQAIPIQLTTDAFKEDC